VKSNDPADLPIRPMDKEKRQEVFLAFSVSSGFAKADQ